MKQKLIAGFIGLALAPAAFSQPSQIWENTAEIISPSDAYPYAPQIDALTFLNDPGATFDLTTSSLYVTADTLNYTNRGFMVGFPGFDFETFSSTTGQPKMAANFANLASGSGNGVIDVNGQFSFLAPGFFFGSLAGNARMIVKATNILNNGSVNLSASSLLRMEGKNIDITRGALTMANPNNTFIFGTNVISIPVLNGLFSSGLLDGWWGATTATNAMIPANLVFGISPAHIVTNRNLNVNYFNTVFLTQPIAYVNDTGIVGSNRFVQVVFLSNLDTNFINTVYLTPFQVAVQWQWNTPNWPGAGVTTNYMYLTDNFGEVTNIGVALNGEINPQALYPTFTYKPINYNFFFGAPYTFATPAAPGLVPGVLDNGAVTNQNAGYQAIFTVGTQLPTDVAGGNPTNMSGRVELVADNTLNLSRSRIASLNYLLLRATNHFIGSPNAVISSPYTDAYLRTTNGVLSVTNLIVPFLPHPAGTCNLWSGRWTNVVNGITNSFHALYVDSEFVPTGTPLIQTLDLTVTNFVNSGSNNLVINDILNVTSNLFLRAERITIATNGPDAFTAAGQLNILNGKVVWPTITPGLQYLTNWGSISMNNAVFFGGSHTEPPYNTNLVNVPYQAFVNHGGVTNLSSSIWAAYFENTGGIFESIRGPIDLHQCNTAVLANGLFDTSFGGEVSLYVGNLSISNHPIYAASSLSLYVTNAITDGGGPLNGNLWTCQDGFNLLVKPPAGDLLGTMVFNFAADYAETLNYWAGVDRGPNSSGFSNNCAVGQLNLFGGTNSAFHFIGTGSSNALYVDLLNLLGSATDRDAAGNFIGLDIDPNITIYFADATANGVSIAEKLNGKNGGRLVWVSSYAGLFSSTNMLYPDGNTYTFNRALVQSCNIDSDGDGIANCSDPTPIFVFNPLRVSVTATNQPRAAMILKWPTPAYSTNFVYYNSGVHGTNWQLLTNFVFGPNNGTASVTDPLTATSRLYRVRVDVRKY